MRDTNFDSIAQEIVTTLKGISGQVDIIKLHDQRKEHDIREFNLKSNLFLLFEVGLLYYAFTFFYIIPLYIVLLGVGTGKLIEYLWLIRCSK